MLQRIGLSAVDELFRDIPEANRRPNLCLPHPLSEQELTEEIARIGAENRSTAEFASFLGGGAYRHYIPSVVGAVVGRSEFYTAYTPYQPEISQGTLQAAFEFQSMTCELLGMDVANAGMYDGASALAEACLMATAIAGRRRIAVLDSVNRSTLKVIQTYAGGHGYPVDLLTPGEQLSTEHACLAIQQPNYFGYLEPVEALVAVAHTAGALAVVSAEPISLGLLLPPGAYGADIAVAEGQPLGCELNYGGPYVGLFACRQQFVRHMPGRIVGRTHDARGHTGYVLTLQTREQHIRRERATSNICTSEQLLALAVAVYLAAVGPHGLRQIAQLCYHRAHYAAQKIAGLPCYDLANDRPFFQEFVVRCPRPPSELLPALVQRGILGGIDVSDRIDNGLLVCVTELNPRAQIDRLVQALAECGGGR